MTGKTYLASLNETLHRVMAAHPEVMFIGEDVLDPYGGAFKVAKGLHTKFPDRVFSTPVSEAGIVGVGAGLAMRGFRPVVEIMFGDFLTLATDQLVNTAAKFPLMYRGKVAVPLVVRTPMGGRRGYGPTHSQAIEKMFLGVPGVKVVAPSLFHDVGAVLTEAILGELSPVLFVEYKALYPMLLLDPGGPFAVRSAIGSGSYPAVATENFSTGLADATVIAYGGLSSEVAEAMQILKEEEVRVRAIFPSLLSDAGCEYLMNEVNPAGAVIVAEEGTEGFNWGSEIAVRLYESLGARLSRPIVRLASRDDVVPASRELEQQMLVGRDGIVAAILRSLS